MFLNISTNGMEHSAVHRHKVQIARWFTFGIIIKRSSHTTQTCTTSMSVEFKKNKMKFFIISFEQTRMF